MHCHLERHASWGMDTILIVKDRLSNDQKALPPPRDVYLEPAISLVVEQPRAALGKSFHTRSTLFLVLSHRILRRISFPCQIISYLT